jgi:hypothetical protein
MKRAEREATDLRGNRPWIRDPEAPTVKERRALRRKARRKMKRALPEGKETARRASGDAGRDET